MASKRNVQYSQPEVPTFLKKFKERVGYKEAVNINDKFADNVEYSEETSIGNNDENEEEQPVVVVLKKGDMSAEEVEKHKQEQSDKDDCWNIKDDKPVFKKPTKRTSSSKTKESGVKKKKPNIKPVKNSKLLSFNEDEDDG